MLSIPGRAGATCDGTSRRELLRIGGAGLLGMSLAQMFELQAQAVEGTAPAARARNLIFIFLQGGPSHIDIWDPKPEASEGIRGEFASIPTAVPGVAVTEVMPRLARVLDKAMLIRSLSYTPAGLLNHTAAMYQMLTGYTPDRVSPAGQLEPPNRNDFPVFGSQIVRLRPPAQPMLPFVMLPRQVQESGVINKGATAGFLGAAYDPYYFFQDPNAPFNVDDLSLRQDVTQDRMRRRATLWQKVNAAMPEIEKAVDQHALNSYYARALDLIISGRARQAFRIEDEPAELRDRYGRSTFGQSLLLARRLIEAGTRVVQVNWPAVANGEPAVDAFDTHRANFTALRDLHCPKLDAGLAMLLEDLDARGLLDETIVLALGEFGRSPKMGVSTSGNGNTADGRDHWPYCYTALIAGGGIARGAVYGRSDATGSAPAENPVHPVQLLATVYHALGINPHTLVHNHLNQPRELVQADPLLELLA